MNGYWYPWSTDAGDYVSAWRRVVRVFAAAGAGNVRFVWSPNPNLYESEPAWRSGVMRYWPGAQYDDGVGSTMIDFGGIKSYPVRRFVPRLEWLRRRFGKPVLLTETNTAYAGRLSWLADLRTMLASRPWLTAVVWSQLPSGGTVEQRGTGVLDWDARRDPAAAPRLAAIVRDGVALSARGGRP
jgi:beta-mannanase